ncbi:MAG: zinc-ribbon domain-containing protein, partial [Ruminococcus sp.]|nr:zinc-ribbon domain-containing protein [Ruminococcus sp.]
MYCRKCGTKNEADDKFCTGCGAALQKDTYIASEAKKSKKTNVKLFAGIGIAILLIACIIAAILIFPEKRREKQFNDLVVCAERYFEELNYEKAEAAYLEA